MKPFILISLYVCLNNIFVFGQVCDSSGYFPYAVGNKWEWRYDNDTSIVTTAITKDSTGIDGTVYLFYNGSNIPGYKIDTSSRVYQYLNITDTLGHVTLGQPFLLYKLDAQAGDSFYTNNNNVLIKVNVFPSSAFGHSVNIKHFTWYAQPSNYWFLSSSLAWGFGQIQSAGPFPGVVSGCHIDGVDYGSLLSVNKSHSVILNDFHLFQNYPNPFNPSTIIQYQIPTTGRVTLKIYNLLGQLVETLVDRIESAGFHNVSWTPHISTGVYIYRLQSAQVEQSKILTYLK